MNRYRSRVNPEIEVRAEKLTPQNVDVLMHWTSGVKVVEIDPHDSSQTFSGLNIKTPDGWVRASEGDYIARGPQGFDKWHPGIFEQAFEQVP